MSESYWDSVAEELNERLQECSQIAQTELAALLNVGLEFISSMLEPRLGTVVKGRLEGGQLYTPAYVARVSAMVRGAARGITVPTNLKARFLDHFVEEYIGHQLSLPLLKRKVSIHSFNRILLSAMSFCKNSEFPSLFNSCSPDILKIYL
ncbi:hypothetical protein L6164_019162 [Bauhinia variegata]|uniref:Uncharacterized protein n=1 Tax=Bauhinia variegata TaxID=167791 RepID=A0ACB9NEU8_BAUVA|nr:hypothetical protein L6164_019162 [Bauhinia variegata]